jgi:hypothetical protein
MPVPFRPHGPSAGLKRRPALTIATLCVGLSVGLAGCSPFEPNPAAPGGAGAAAQPVAPAATGAAATVPTPAAASPATTPPAVTAGETVAFSGVAALSSGPLVHAKLTATNAVTGKELTIVAAQSGVVNSPGKPYATTDDKGYYAVMIADMKPGDAALLTFTNDGKTLSVIATQDGQVFGRALPDAPKKRRLAALASNPLFQNPLWWFGTPNPSPIDGDNSTSKVLYRAFIYSSE